MKTRNRYIKVGNWDLNRDNPTDYVTCLNELSSTLDRRLKDPDFGVKFVMAKLAEDLARMARAALELSKASND